MHPLRLVPTLVGAAMLMAGPAEAQTDASSRTAATTGSARVAPTTKTTKTDVPVQRTAKSLACSKQADARGLHGTSRKHFMSTCKKA